MPLTSPGNDDDTGENHQPTLRKNTAEPVEQTLKQNTNAQKRHSPASTVPSKWSRAAVTSNSSVVVNTSPYPATLVQFGMGWGTGGHGLGL